MLMWPTIPLGCNKCFLGDGGGGGRGKLLVRADKIWCLYFDKFRWNKVKIWFGFT